MKVNNSHIVLFDGVCNLCNAAVRTIIKNDKKNKFQFASLQSNTGTKLAQSFNLNEKSYSTLILIIGDEAFTKSTAALKVASKMDFPWPLLRIFYIVPKPIRNWLYTLIAKNRYRIFGKQEKCWVPNEKLNHKFIA